MDTVKVKRESKRKIRVDFERAPLMERLKAKFLNMYFVKVSRSLHQQGGTKNLKSSSFS